MNLKKGFSLVELSIVLIIIGLLVGGITSGNKLIQQAKLRKVMQDIKTYVTDIQTFYVEYDALPGDITDAESFFGASNTDNGDGDGNVEYTGNTDADSDSNPDGESFNFFKHIELAEINTGLSLTLGATDANYSSTNSPVGPFSGTIYHSEYDSAGDHSFAIAKNAVYYTASDNSTADHNGALTVESAKGIDTKIDDGIAYSGDVYGVDGDDVTAGDCSAAADAANTSTDYNSSPSATDTDCYLVVFYSIN